MLRLSSPVTQSNLSDATHLARPIGIDTYQEPVIYMRSDCPVCKSEGLQSQSRVLIRGNDKSLIATLNVVYGDLVVDGEAGLSDAAWTMLGSKKPCLITLSHPEQVNSFRFVRSKLFGNTLKQSELDAIVNDVTKRLYSDVQLCAFLSACVGDRMNSQEIVSLTRSMVRVGKKLDWGKKEVFDKHCVGGLPGNRTTPIVVAIATACGLTMPKTSSRAITSPAGTADTMQTLTRVDISLAQIKRVVEQEGGCMVWGGSVDLSPADDVLIRVERALNIDSDAQLVASVLSKKVAAGSTHVLIDIPVGPTAKVRDQITAKHLSRLLKETGKALGLVVDILITDGSQPIGKGIGPALEARDILAVLQNKPNAPLDLRDRAVLIAGKILEQSHHVPIGQGSVKALEVIQDGRAWIKFQAICRAQGGLFTPPIASHQHVVLANKAGRVNTIDNRRLAMVAKLAGAPTVAAAGVELFVHQNDTVEEGEPVLTVHAEAPGELAYALGYLSRNSDMININ